MQDVVQAPGVNRNNIGVALDRRIVEPCISKALLFWAHPQFAGVAPLSGSNTPQSK